MLEQPAETVSCQHDEGVSDSHQAANDQDRLITKAVGDNAGGTPRENY